MTVLQLAPSKEEEYLAVLNPCDWQVANVEDGPLSADSCTTRQCCQPTLFISETDYAMQEALLAVHRGIKAMVLRLAPYCWGNGGSTFIPVQLQAARTVGISYYVLPGELCPWNA